MKLTAQQLSRWNEVEKRHLTIQKLRNQQNWIKFETLALKLEPGVTRKFQDGKNPIYGIKLITGDVYLLTTKKTSIMINGLYAVKVEIGFREHYPVKVKEEPKYELKYKEQPKPVVKGRKTLLVRKIEKLRKQGFEVLKTWSEQNEYLEIVNKALVRKCQTTLKVTL